VKVKKRAGKALRKKITLKQRILLILFGISLLAALELVLQLLPLGAESEAEGDPFIGFSSTNPLFVPYRTVSGGKRMKTAHGKLMWFNPQDFELRKEPGTFRIFTLGGSTTYGHPFADATSFSGWLRKLLGRIPDSAVRYEVINAGGISYASYRVVTVLKELLKYEPDLFVIYTGHNEFLETRTYKDFFNQSSLTFKTRELLSRLKSYRLLARCYRNLRANFTRGPEPGSQASTNVLTPEVQTILDRSAGLEYYQRDTLFFRGVFEHFHYNVARMKRLCRQAGVPVLFLEPVDNIKDFSPFKSQHRDGMDSRTLVRFDRLMSEGFSLLGEGWIGEGLEKFKEALAIDSLYADCNFYLGKAYLEAGDTATAGRYLLAARELDVCPLRAQEPIHKILREETAGSDDPDLLDLPGLFRQLSPGGLIGEEVLVDHIHPFPEGYLRIALEILEWMREKGFVQGNYFPTADELSTIYQEVMGSVPPEYFRRGIINLAKVLIWAKKFRETYLVLESQWPLLAEEGEAQYLMGSALMRLGNPEKALTHLQKALALAPDHIFVLVRLAELYQALNQPDSAKATYERMNELYPGNNAMLSNYAGLLGRMGQTDSALAIFNRIKRQEPDLSGLDINIGTIYSSTGEYTRAIEAFKEAAKRESEAEEAFYNLATLYVILGKPEEAEKYFLEVIRRKPEHVSAHINLGNIYQNTGRLSQAEEQFRLALLINPALLAPYVNLALLYKSTGNEELLSQVVRLGLQRFPDNPALKKLSSEQALK